MGDADVKSSIKNGDRPIKDPFPISGLVSGCSAKMDPYVLLRLLFYQPELLQGRQPTHCAFGVAQVLPLMIVLFGQTVSTRLSVL